MVIYGYRKKKHLKKKSYFPVLVLHRSTTDTSLVQPVDNNIVLQNNVTLILREIIADVFLKRLNPE